MAVVLLTLALLSAVTAAPPNGPRGYGQPPPAQLQHLNPLDFYLENPEANFYNQAPQKQGQLQSPSGNGNAAPARLETLEPDSEVEIIAGGQQPQQPPQQNPVSPNLPGLIPGQRVYIVHMPVAGYRPGTVGGYQPVYVVAAAPQGNPNYVQGQGGYQNTVLLDTSGQGLVSPFLGYQRPAGQAVNPGFLLAGSPYSFNRQFDLGYQNPGYGFQPIAGVGQNQGAAAQGPLRFGQLVAVHPQQRAPGLQAASTNEKLRQNADRHTVIETSEVNEDKQEIDESGSRHRTKA